MLVDLYMLVPVSGDLASPHVGYMSGFEGAINFILFINLRDSTSFALLYLPWPQSDPDFVSARYATEPITQE